MAILIGTNGHFDCRTTTKYEKIKKNRKFLAKSCKILQKPAKTCKKLQNSAKSRPFRALFSTLSAFSGTFMHVSRSLGTSPILPGLHSLTRRPHRPKPWFSRWRRKAHLHPITHIQPNTHLQRISWLLSYCMCGRCLLRSSMKRNPSFQ